MNAREEFLEFIKDKPSVICAEVRYLKEDSQLVAVLRLAHSNNDWDNFLQVLNFLYDDGCQGLLGTVWFEGGSWADRGEYDGSEWWKYQKHPDIPPGLQAVV